jgi:TPP-dependent pyruvate/acetoin dehydrogenase alpha subunit
MTADEQNKMKETVMKDVAEAEAFARKSPYPTIQSVHARLGA